MPLSLAADEYRLSSIAVEPAPPSRIAQVRYSDSQKTIQTSGIIKDMTELRFAFGRNWSDFIEQKLNDDVIRQSMDHMAGVLRQPSLAGKTFLDIGCGSGIHSLAALRLGAERVVAFDYDQNSVDTAIRVREWAKIPEAGWRISQGSVLDAALIHSLGKFDIVYSWGVLHHTGEMWHAVRNAAVPLKPGGDFYIALYSSDNYVDPPPEYWVRLKRAYNQANSMTRKIMELRYVNGLISGAGSLAQIDNYGLRGMELWTDVKDWLGGYPMEFAGFAETRDLAKAELGLDLVNVITGEGCTEYVFTQLAASPHWQAEEGKRVRKTLAGPFEHVRGHGFAASSLAASAGRDLSAMMIYEDSKPLGLARSREHDILVHGRGRFIYTPARMLFSSGDNSDPNSNGRSYAYCEQY